MIANVLSAMAHLAFEKYQKDTLVLLNEEPLYAFLQVDSRVELTRGIDVAAVSMEDGDFVLYLNPEGYLSYPQAERLFILKHEWTHWIDEHPLLNSLYIIKLWSLACDLSINQDLETSICRRPKDAQMPEMYGFPPHLTPEQYYHLLLEQHNQRKLKIHKSLTSIAQGQNLKKEKYDESKPFPIKGMITKKSKMQNGILLIRVDRNFVIFSNENSFYNKEGESISFDDLEVEKDFAEALVLYKDGGFLGLQLRLIEKPNESDDGSGDNSLELSEKNLNIDESNTDTDEISVDDLENLHPTWKDINKNSPEINKENLNDKVKSAINHAGDQIPKGLSEKVKRFMKSDANWKGELSIIIASHKGQKKQYTYRKRNKRNPYAPGVKKSSRLKVVIIVDTSMSISKEQLEVFDAEIRKIADTSRNIEIIVIVCDAAIRDVYKYNHLLVNENITFSGRGGTDFRPPFNLIDTRDHKLLKIPPDLVIYLTDGGGVAPEHFDIPTLWVLTPKGVLPSIKNLRSGEQVTWGKTIRLNE